MRLYKKIQVTEYAVKEVRCNRCGCLIPTDITGRCADYLSIEKQWGYGTTLDGCSHSFELCENCYKAIISEFVIPPEEDGNRL